MSEFINKWRTSLDRTRKATFGKIATVFGATDVTEETWENLESLLIQSDVGVDTSQLIIEKLRKAVSDQGITKQEDFQQALKSILVDLLLPPSSWIWRPTTRQ